MLPKRWRSRFLLAAAALVALGAVAIVSYARVALADLPSPATDPLLARSIVVYDRNGKVLAERNQQGVYHVVLRLDQIGKTAVGATLAAEDRDFYNHGALDLAGIARAIIADTLAGRPVHSADRPFIR